MYERERTGAGSTLEVSILDALGEWMVQPAYLCWYGEEGPRRTGARHASIAPYGAYATKDASVFFGLQSDREFGVLCREVLARPELIHDPRFARNTERVANNRKLTGIIESAFADKTAEQVLELLERVGIANARLRTPAEFFEHPQLQARDRWRSVNTPGGPIRALKPPVTVQGREPMMGDVPALGQHNVSIREEFEALTD